MAKMLDVPYRSQWDADANRSTTDCGPACLAMVLDYYGKQVAINELLAATGVAPGKYVGFGQLQRVAKAHGVTFEYSANLKLTDLTRWIDEGKPAIALVKYSYWSQIEPRVSTQDDFTGPHFVVVVGYGDGNIYINDPNYWPPRREEGYQKAWSEVLFNLAWSNVRTSRSSNPNNSVIVPTVSKTDEGAAGSDVIDTSEQDSSVSKEEDAGLVIEYTVQASDTWSDLAARFYGDRTRYAEIMDYNNIGDGVPLFVGQKLCILLAEEPGEAALADQPMILGQGAVQMVDSGLVKSLKDKWIAAGKSATTADEATVLRAFLDGIVRQDIPKPAVGGSVRRDTPKPAVIEYVAQPGDTWPSIAGRFLGDQMRYAEIIAFNQLSPDAPLRVGQTLRIPPK